MMRALLVATALASCHQVADEPLPYLVQAEEVVEHGAGPGRVIIDLRSPDAFAAGHVPGSVSLDIEALRAEVDGVPGQLAPRATVAAAMAALGVDLDDDVVAVDESTSPHAARLVWTLHSFGHDRARVLDGGHPAYLAAGGVQSLGLAVPAAGEQPLGDERPDLRVDAAWVLAHLGDPAVRLLDVRTDDEWSAGRIPGAVHFPWERALAEDDALLPSATLRELYAQELASPTVVVYCKSGMRASLTWLVLLSLGHADVRVYDGSWNEWGMRADLPKET